MHPPYIALYAADFLADVTALGNTELGIYWRLLLVYYQTRKPLPVDRDKLTRIAMAFTPEEIRALDYVLEQHFVVGIDGQDNQRVYRNKRADRELSAAADRWNAAHNRGVSAANARWHAQAMHEHMHKHSLSNSNQNQNQNQNQNLEQEPKKALVNIPLRNGELYPIFEDLAAQLDRTFPSVDVVGTLREIETWNTLNPQKRKTKTGVMRHINSWFRIEQDKSHAKAR